MSESDKIWPKKISVDKRIVSILSEQTYENFPNAVKEMITNSYDAEATKVSIMLDLPNERLEVTDNGWGMSESEFNFYLRIAGKRREKSAKTPSGRAIIGQFGVGFLSVFPFFKTLTIRTKKKNSNQVTYANIPCYEYFSNRSLDITDINIQGGVRLENDRHRESFTEITLSGFTDICKTFFYPQQNLKNRRISIQNFGSVEKLKWKLEEDLPLNYANPAFDAMTVQYSPNLPFTVTFNGQPLKRQVYGDTVLEQSIDIVAIGQIRFQYFIATSKRSVTPHEARYLKIRNLNAGVGDRKNFGLGTEVGGSRSRLHWLTGEIHVVDGLNEIITVSRNDFNYSPDLEEFREFFVKKLAFFSNEMEKEAELNSFINQSHEETIVKDLSLLNPTVIARKVEEIKRYSEPSPQPELQELTENGIDHISSQISTRPIQLPEVENLSFQKRLSIHNSNYLLKLDRWDFKNDPFPAVKFDGDDMVINSTYPLFAGKKYTDIFLKTHLLMIQYLKENIIEQETYDLFISDMLNLFNDYTK